VPENGHVHQAFCQKAIENILAHLTCTELQETPSMSMTASQEQSLTNLLCECLGVFPETEYDLGTLTAVKHQIDISEANPTGLPFRWTPLNIQVEEASEVLKAQRIRGPTYLSMVRLQKQVDKG
jgi:hypothetical protein